MNYLAKNLRDWMLANGIKEEAAGEKIGVAQSTINRITKPDSSKPIRNPSSATLGKIAKALGSTTHDIVHRDLTVPAPASQPAGLDERKLAVALVAVEKAIRAKGLDPAESWGPLAGLVLWAIDLQDELYPAGVLSPADLRGFDAQVQIEMEKGGHHGVRRVGSATGRGIEGVSSSAPARQAPRRGRK